MLRLMRATSEKIQHTEGARKGKEAAHYKRNDAIERRRVNLGLARSYLGYEK